MAHSVMLVFVLVNKPTIEYFHLIKWTEDGKPQRMKLLEKISRKWKDIGYILGQQEVDINRYEKKTWYDTFECSREVFNHWFADDSSKYPKTWEGVCELLEDAGYKQVQIQLVEALNCIGVPVQLIDKDATAAEVEPEVEHEVESEVESA